MTKVEIFARLNQITSLYSFIHVIANITVLDFCSTIDELATKNTREHLNYNEVAFLIGLWLKNVNVAARVGFSEQQKLTTETYQLMESLHLTFFKDFPEIDTKAPKNVYDFFTDGEMFKETMFYSGTGAYDYQYMKWVSSKYKYDKNWMLEKKGIDIDLIPKFYDSLRDQLQSKLNNRKFSVDIDPNEAILNLFCLSKSEIITENSQFEQILNHLITDLKYQHNSTFNDLGDFNIFSERPIIKLPDDRYFIPIVYSVAEALYESPFYWMNQDKEYSPIALHNRGRIAEEITFSMVKTVFGEASTYKDLLIKGKGGNRITDIDVIAIHSHTALIFQVKSKKLTSLSKKGDLISIKNDFKKAVKDAYDQGVISSKCLLNMEEHSFSLPGNDHFNFDGVVTKCYIIPVVLDCYPAITHQTYILLGGELEEIPVAISIFDLEVVARYLPEPDKLIDYISRRTKFSKYFKADNELCFLGFHLKKGLQRFKGSDMVALDESWAQAIDKMYYPEIAGLTSIEPTGLKKVGRNDPCPCGSGKKYKKCHGA